jgi:FkbM family methyltransferase
MSVTSLKLLAKDLLRAVGFELHRAKYVNSEESVLRSLFASTRPGAIVDVGANTGQYARLVRRVGFRGRIVSFEAIPAVHEILRRESAGDSAWLVAPCAALGSKSGTVEINLAGNSVSSSILPMNAAHVEAAPDSRYVSSQTIRLERLDLLAPTLLEGTRNWLLKIDTQGFEAEVLRGATSLLPDIAAMQVEMSLVTLYEGAPRLVEMIALIEELGYELFSIVPGLRNLQSGRLLQADGFFVRS